MKWQLTINSESRLCYSRINRPGAAGGGVTSTSSSSVGCFPAPRRCDMSNISGMSSDTSDIRKSVLLTLWNYYIGGRYIIRMRDSGWGHYTPQNNVNSQQIKFNLKKTRAANLTRKPCQPSVNILCAVRPNFDRLSWKWAHNNGERSHQFWFFYAF